MSIAPQNIWDNSWGSQTNRESTPPSGWDWDFGKGAWIYSGQIPVDPTPPTNTTIYQTSSVDCFPDVVVNTSGDPSFPGPAIDPVVIPGVTTGTVPSTPPAPPVSDPLRPVPTFGHLYNVCFDDGLLNQKGWTRPRFEGTKLRALYYNEYTDEMEEGKELGPIQNPNLDTSIDGLQFIITASHEITLQNKAQVGNPFEKKENHGITRTLYKVIVPSCYWYNEFSDNYNGREKYPPKHIDLTNIPAGKNATYQKADRELPQAPFGPKIYDVPLIPTTYYKIDEYTQLPEKIERKDALPGDKRFNGIREKGFDLIPTPIKLNPVDPEGLNGGPFILGTDPGQDETYPGDASHQIQIGVDSSGNIIYQSDPYGDAGNNRLSSEYQIKYIDREYVHNGPWSYDVVNEVVLPDGSITHSITPVSGIANPTNDATWGYIDTQISRSTIIPNKDPIGDITYGKTPVIENYSNAIFFGNTVYGYQQSDVFPGPGPDFSYIKLEKAYVFNSEDDSFFVQEIKSEGEDIAFQNFMQSTFPWSTDFRLKLLDYDQENNLKTGYRVHWNRGYFSEIATYTTQSAHRTASGHYPGTGRNFIGTGSAYGGNNYIEGTGNGSGLVSQANNSNFYNEGAMFRRTGATGFFYLHSNNGGGEAALLTGGFKSAGMQFGLGELEFPKFQTAVAPGNWDSGPGTSNFFGIDPLPGGMRYYTFKFFPINNPIYGMNADDSLKSQRGRMLSGTFEINEKNPSTDWWFRQGGQKEILWVSESVSGDVSASMKIFMDECYKQTDDLYIITFNEAKNVDQSFNQSFQRKNHPFLKRRTDNVQGYPGDPNYIDPATGNLDPFGDANIGEPSNTGSYSFYKTYSRPLNTFGSVIFNTDASTNVGVRNAHNSLEKRDASLRLNQKYDYSATAISWSLANPNSTLSKRDPNYFGIQNGTGPMGGMHFGGINAPRFTNGGPFIEVGDIDGRNFVDDGGGTQKDGALVGGSWMYDSVSVWTAYQYGNNWTHYYTGTKYIDFRKRKGWPALNKWTISKLEEKPNYLLADINKSEELPQGVGTKGFILIPDTLNPRIKANLDFYLSKAGLIDKERAPKYKDRQIKKGTYLPPKIKRKKRKRRGFFWKLKKRIKGKDY